LTGVHPSTIIDSCNATRKEVRMFKLLICGDRHWSNSKAIERDLRKLIERKGRADKILVIHGGARGADSLAGEVAQELGIHTARVDALWDSYHRGAGPKRNAVMLTLNPDAVWAYHENLQDSRGTADMVRRAEKQGTIVKVRRK
jgi:hypothetical protein